MDYRGSSSGGFTCVYFEKRALARQSHVGKFAPTSTIWNKTLKTPATDGKMHVNALYHSAVVFGLAAGYARLGKMAIGGSPPKLDFTLRDVGVVMVEVALAMATKDMLIKHGLIPADILK